MGLRLPNVNFPWLVLDGLGLELTLPVPASLLEVRGTAAMVASVALLDPGLVLGVGLVEVGLPGDVGVTMPGMVLDTRAETVGEAGPGGLVPGETLEAVETRCGLVPLSAGLGPAGIST